VALDHNPIYSFQIEDHKFAANIAEQLFDAQVEDKTFTYKHFQTRSGHIFKVEVFAEGSEELKKILFLAGLKLKSGITTR